MPERLIGRINQQDAELISGLYQENAAHVTGQRTIIGRQAIAEWQARRMAGLPTDAPPRDDEIASNPRARSARLRIALRTAAPAWEEAA